MATPHPTALAWTSGYESRKKKDGVDPVDMSPEVLFFDYRLQRHGRVLIQKSGSRTTRRFVFVCQGCTQPFGNSKKDLFCKTCRPPPLVKAPLTEQDRRTKLRREMLTDAIIMLAQLQLTSRATIKHSSDETKKLYKRLVLSFTNPKQNSLLCHCEAETNRRTLAPYSIKDATFKPSVRQFGRLLATEGKNRHHSANWTIQDMMKFIPGAEKPLRDFASCYMAHLGAPLELALGNCTTSTTTPPVPSGFAIEDISDDLDAVPLGFWITADLTYTKIISVTPTALRAHTETAKAIRCRYRAAFDVLDFVAFIEGVLELRQQILSSKLIEPVSVQKAKENPTQLLLDGKNMTPCDQLLVDGESTSKPTIIQQTRAKLCEVLTHAFLGCREEPDPEKLQQHVERIQTYTTENFGCRVKAASIQRGVEAACSGGNAPVHAVATTISNGFRHGLLPPTEKAKLIRTLANVVTKHKLNPLWFLARPASKGFTVDPVPTKDQLQSLHMGLGNIDVNSLLHDEIESAVRDIRDAVAECTQHLPPRDEVMRGALREPLLSTLATNAQTALRRFFVEYNTNRQISIMPQGHALQNFVEALGDEAVVTATHMYSAANALVPGSVQAQYDSLDLGRLYRECKDHILVSNKMLLDKDKWSSCMKWDNVRESVSELLHYMHLAQDFHNAPAHVTPTGWLLPISAAAIPSQRLENTEVRVPRTYKKHFKKDDYRSMKCVVEQRLREVLVLDTRAKCSGENWILSPQVA